VNDLRIEDWASASVFLAVARSGSMLAGAKALGMSQPSVSRAIQHLEDGAGQRLFVRHARGVRLTPVGEALRLHVERAESSLHHFQRVARGKATVEGTLRIATTEFLGVEVFAPRLHELRELFPRLRLELVLENTASDLTRGEADVAVRLFRTQKPELVTRLVAHLELGMYASHDYVARRGAPETFDELFEHELIGYDPRGPMAGLYAQLDPRFAPSAFAVGTDCLSAQVALARGGFGIAALQVGFAQRYEELVRVLPELPLPRAEAWLVTHEDLKTSGHVRAAFDWLERVMVDYEATTARNPSAKNSQTLRTRGAL
jgi:DNA-binding transcriptional LysR family regulator